MQRSTEAIKGWLFRSEHLTRWLRVLRVLWHHRQSAPHEADFYFLQSPAFANGLLLDLGANIGQSALSVAKVQPGMSILSIEANPACEPGLRMTQRLLGGRFAYRLVGVGCQAGQMSFHVPVRASRMLLEEGTFDATSLESEAARRRLGRRGVDYELTHMEVPVVTVDSMAVSPVVVKMDLQGLELAALEGMVDTLTRCRPALLIENGDRHADVTALLGSMGYVAHHWAGHQLVRGERAGGLNTVFLANTGSPTLHPTDDFIAQRASQTQADREPL